MNELFIRRKFINLYTNISWLTQETRDAIVAAFGEIDGRSVIVATKAYLDNIAESDSEKAQALAGFINEDPMLVCSLVETGKTRWLDNGGSAYIELDYYHNANTKVLAHMKLNSLGSQKFLFGAASNSNYGSCFTIYEYPNGQISWNNGDGAAGWHESSRVYFDLEEHDIEFVAGKYITVSGLIEKNTAGIRSLTKVCTRKFRVFFDNGDSHHGQPDMKYSKFIINEEEKDIITLCPFIHQGANGMLDIITGTFYPNANKQGSFSIEYTLPDGTPWIPANSQ